MLFFTLAEMVAKDTKDNDFSIGFQLGGSGATLGWQNGFPISNFRVNLHFPRLPIYWSGGLLLYGSGLGGNINADLSIVRAPIASWLDFYFRIGLGVSFWVDNTFGFGTVAKFPVGLSFWPLDWLEPNIQITPALGLALGTRSDRVAWFIADIAIHVGVNFWFN